MAIMYGKRGHDVYFLLAIWLLAFTGQSVAFRRARSISKISMFTWADL